MLEPVTTFGNKAEREIQKFDSLKTVLEKIAIDHPRGSVFLIGRYHHNAPEDLRELQKAFKNIKIAYHTAHACKGLTCDVTILLDADSGVYGFPSEMADDPILSNLLQEGESFENAEERRLFYVALTRARRQVYILYNPQSKSKFLDELHEALNMESFLISDKQCPKCDGIMTMRNSVKGKFWGCTNYPHCRQTVAYTDTTYIADH